MLLKLISPLRPGLIEAGDESRFRYLIMPIRLNVEVGPPVRVVRVTVRDFRGYGKEHAEFGDVLTVITGPNGAGKTNLLEALYFGCTGRSCRTTNEREVIRFGRARRAWSSPRRGDDGPHELAVGFAREPKRMRVDGAPVERLVDVRAAPGERLLPDRLELVKGAPACAAPTWTSSWRRLARAGATRRAYAQALASAMR